MNFVLYQAMKNELNLREKGETGKLFSNQTTEQLKRLIATYEAEIALYAMVKMLVHNNKLERCEC